MPVFIQDKPSWCNFRLVTLVERKSGFFHLGDAGSVLVKISLLASCLIYPGKYVFSCSPYSSTAVCFFGENFLQYLDSVYAAIIIIDQWVLIHCPLI